MKIVNQFITAQITVPDPRSMQHDVTNSVLSVKNKNMPARLDMSLPSYFKQPKKLKSGLTMKDMRQHDRKEKTPNAMSELAEVYMNFEGRVNTS